MPLTGLRWKNMRRLVIDCSEHEPRLIGGDSAVRDPPPPRAEFARIRAGRIPGLSSRLDFNPKRIFLYFGHHQDLALLLFGDLKGVGTGQGSSDRNPAGLAGLAD
jgi:hypothetical protein